MANRSSQQKVSPSEAGKPAGPADRLLLAVSGASPWVLSLFIHALVLTSLVFVVKVGSPNQAALVPEAFLAGRQPMELAPTRRPLQLDTNRSAESWQDRAPVRQLPAPDRFAGEARLTDLVPSDRQPGVAMAWPAPQPVGVARPASTLYGTGGDAWHVVYVIDRSGSMRLDFERVCREVIASLAKLDERQQFHVILFGQDRTVENPPARLISATLENKLAAAGFLQTVTAEGSTTALPALRRAFETLRQSGRDRKRPGKLIYFLTDGLFEGHEVISSQYRLADGTVLEGSAAMITWLRQNNLGGAVQINTYLYDTDGSASPQSVAVMRQIATENGGLFKHIQGR